MPNITRIYNEAHDPSGPLDATERAAAITICDRARGKDEAILFLTMCGLLREGGA